MTKKRPPSRTPHEWEHVSFKVPVEMMKKIEADMAIVDAHTKAEYFRFLLRERFYRVK